MQRFGSSIATSIINHRSQDNLCFPTLRKWNPSSTNVKSIKIYVPTFWNSWFKKLSSKTQPQTTLDEESPKAASLILEWHVTFHLWYTTLWGWGYEERAIEHNTKPKHENEAYHGSIDVDTEQQ